MCTLCAGLFKMNGIRQMNVAWHVSMPHTLAFIVKCLFNRLKWEILNHFQWNKKPFVSISTHMMDYRKTVCHVWRDAEEGYHIIRRLINELDRITSNLYDRVIGIIDVLILHHHTTHIFAVAFNLFRRFNQS